MARHFGLPRRQAPVTDCGGLPALAWGLAAWALLVGLGIAGAWWLS